MKMVIVTILDTAAGAYGRPAFVASEGVAIRQFQDEVNRESDDNQLYRHPDDFSYSIWVLLMIILVQWIY